MEDFATYLNNLGIAYFVSCAVCLVYTIGLLIANWWTGEDIEGHLLFTVLFVAVIPMLNVYALMNNIGTLLSRKIGKFSIKGRKKQ